MSKKSLMFRIEQKDGAWGVVDSNDASVNVRVDQIVIDASWVSPDKRAVEGYILAVHGLDFEIASGLDRAILNQLGVAANYRGLPPPPRRGSGLSRVRLTSGAGRNSLTAA